MNGRLFALVLVCAGCSALEGRTLLLLSVTADPALSAVATVDITAAGQSRSEPGPLPLDVGLYFPRGTGGRQALSVAALDEEGCTLARTSSAIDLVEGSKVSVSLDLEPAATPCRPPTPDAGAASLPGASLPDAGNGPPGGASNRPVVCGDGLCTGAETQNTCCDDCGCPSGSVCRASHDCSANVAVWTFTNACPGEGSIRARLWTADCTGVLPPGSIPSWFLPPGTFQVEAGCLPGQYLGLGAAAADGFPRWGRGLNCEQGCRDCCHLCGTRTATTFTCP